MSLPCFLAKHQDIWQYLSHCSRQYLILSDTLSTTMIFLQITMLWNVFWPRWSISGIIRDFVMGNNIFVFKMPLKCILTNKVHILHYLKHCQQQWISGLSAILSTTIMYLSITIPRMHFDQDNGCLPLPVTM